MQCPQYAARSTASTHLHALPLSSLHPQASCASRLRLTCCPPFVPLRAVFLFFIIFFFALIGIALFKGGLRYSCHTGSDELGWESTGDICRPHCTWFEKNASLNGECLSLGVNTLQKESFDETDRLQFTYTCRKGQQCLCSANGLPDPTCSIFGNPNHGITSFDSLPWAIVSLFQASSATASNLAPVWRHAANACIRVLRAPVRVADGLRAYAPPRRVQAISLEGWVDMMYQLMDGVSTWVWTYFLMLVLIGAIIVINLFLAVLCDNFEMADKDGDDKVKAEDGAKVVAASMANLKYSNKLRQAILDLIKHKYFDWFVQGCILLNTTVMMLKYSPMPTNKIRPSITLSDAGHDYMPHGYWLVIFTANIVLTGVFTIESLLKIIGLGPKLFWKDRMNLFDLFVVVFSIVEIVIDVIKRTTGAPVSFPLPLSVLRAFRIFRLFKLVRSVPSLRKILTTLAQSMSSVFYLALLLVLMILIFILLGMELFGGYYPRPELNFTSEKFPNVFIGDSVRPNGISATEMSRYHFDDIGNACLVIFVVLSGENWNEIMFDNHAASFDSNMASDLPLPYALIYFIFLFIIGNLLLFNLFIAILLSNFDDDEEEEEEGDEDADILPGEKESIERADSSPSVAKVAKEEPMFEWKFNGYLQTTSNMLGGVEKVTSTRKSNSSVANGGAGEEEEEEAVEKVAPLFPTSVETSGGDRSLMIFSWQNPIRILFARIVSHWLFETTVITLIVVSTGLMLLDMPHLPLTHPLIEAISGLNVFFAIIFLIEMLIKWVVTGVVISKTPKEYQLAPAYFKSPWNLLDFVIVVFSLLVFVSDVFKPLRVMRALRPLRLVSRYEDLKITVATLFKSIPAMTSLISVAMLFFVIFAILGVELYGGKLGYCMDPLYDGEPYGSRVIPGLNANNQTDYEECMALPRYNLTRRTTAGILFTDMANMEPDKEWLAFTEFPQWFYPQFGNFDNLKLSLVLLFEISALEGWPDVMHWCMDSDQSEQFIVPWRVPHDQGGGLGGVGVPMQKHLPQTGMTAIFFIAWIIVGCFVVVNMTVGVVVDTFTQIKQENDGLLLMSEDAADWVKAQKQVFAQRPLVQAAPPAEAWRLNFYYFVTSTRFEISIMVVILLNMLQMGCDWWEPAYHEPFPAGSSMVNELAGQPNYPAIIGLKQAVSNLNLIFLGIYIVEMVVKWIGLGVVHYFTNVGDFFDFFLVVISTAEAIITLADIDLFPMGFIRVLRLFRVIRILRVIKTAKQLRTVIMTVYISIPQLKNIMVLIFMLILIFDVLMVNLFHAVNYTPGNYDYWYDHRLSVARGEVLPDPDNNYYFSADGTNWGDMINRHANFQNFWTGALVLVRSSTGESFNGIMHDLFDWTWGHNRLSCCFECGPMIEGGTMKEYTLADGSKIERVQPSDSCGNTLPAALIYFIFQIMMAYIVLSIMIGVILENFTNVGSETRKIRVDDLEDFREVWLKYDPKGTFIVPSHNLLAILQQLKQPLGIAGSVPALTRAEMLKHLGKLDIPDHGGYIHFMETLTAVSHHHAGVPVPVCDTTKKMQKAAQQVPKLKVLDKPAHNALTNYLVSLLQSRWRGYAMRKKYDDDPESMPEPAYASQKVKTSQVAPEPTS